MDKSQRKNVIQLGCNDPTYDGIMVERLANYSEEELAQIARPHTHTFYEILWYQEDGGTHTVDFQNYPIQRNTLFFLTPGQVHSFQKSGAAHGYAIKICPDFGKKNTDDCEGLHDQLFFAFENLPYAALDDSGTDAVEAVIRRIEEEQQNIGKENHMELLHLLVRILVIVIRRHAQRLEPINEQLMHPANMLFIRFRTLLEQEFLQTHQVSEYAEKLGVSVKTLGNAVRISTGQTPLTMINMRLILEAKRMLRYSDLLVKEVAYELGFDDPSNFVKFFRHYTGYLPSEFQKKDL